MPPKQNDPVLVALQSELLKAKERWGDEIKLQKAAKDTPNFPFPIGLLRTIPQPVCVARHASRSRWAMRSHGTAFVSASNFQDGEAQSYDVYDIKITLVIDRTPDALTVRDVERAAASCIAMVPPEHSEAGILASAERGEQ